MTEAVGGMLDKARSGRRGVQMQNEQDVILRLLPTLNEGLAMKKVPELRIGCYMLLSIMASKGGLDDKLLTAMMESLVLGWTAETIMPGLVCLSILAQQRGPKQTTKRLTRELLKIDDLPTLLVELSKQQRVGRLANGLCLAITSRLSKTGDASSLHIVGHVLENELLSDAEATVIIKSLLLAAHTIDDSVDVDGTARSQLAVALVTLGSSEQEISRIVRRAMDASEIDMDELEMKLQTTIRPKELPAPDGEDVTMGDANDNTMERRPTFDELLGGLPTRTTNETSFLSHHKSHVFPDLAQTFLAAASSEQNLSRFGAAPLLHSESAEETALYFTFLARIWCGPYPVLARVAALKAANTHLQSVKSVEVDFQALLPYLIVSLSDPATKIRRVATEVIATIAGQYPPTSDSKKKQSKSAKQWAYDDIYGNGPETKATKWLSVEDAGRLMCEILIPGLEECVLDEHHINSLIEKSLNPAKTAQQSPKKGAPAHLSQNLRAAVMSFLASHAIQTPLYRVKLRLLSALNLVRAVASTPRTKVLLPVLQNWSTLSTEEAQSRCASEQVDLLELEGQLTAVVVANDKEGTDFLASVVRGDVASNHPSLVAAAFLRLRQMWPSMKVDMKISTSQLLMDISQTSATASSQSEAMDLLRTISLPTEVLSAFLSQLPTAAKMADNAPASKRRRTSHGEMAKLNPQDSDQLTAAVRKVTFVLQLVDGSDVVAHPQLLPGLFNTLAELQHLKAQVGSELGYLQGLILGSLLSIMQGYKVNPKLDIDRSAVRADLLVDCVQRTASPQVQNAALLLIASIADTAPELVLHSVMPIFTFMGGSVLRQSDDYSAHVIEQTIREVIPPLIASLRKEKGNPVAGAAELLLSFVAAYEHVPSHRRQILFVSLVRTLGPEEFLFALLAMLADKYGTTKSVPAFAVALSGTFSVEIQLQTAVKYLDLVADVLKPKPTLSAILLSSGDASAIDHHRSALKQLVMLPHILSQKRLISQTSKLLAQDDMDAARIRDIYSTLLERLLAMADSLKADKPLHTACGDILQSILGLLSTSEFIKSVESLLDRPNEELRRKILRSLEHRIDQESQSNASSRVAMLNFLPQLTAIIRESTDVLYKHTAIACVDKIAEKYGKKDLEAVSAAAETIASEHCLGQEDDRLRVMALLCLASLVEILREATVAILPVAIPKTLEYMTASVQSDTENEKLHNAGYAFISSLIHHLPYMVTGKYLDSLLTISNASAEAELDVEADESRIQCLQLAAKQIEAKSMFTALEKNWEQARTSGSIVRHHLFESLLVS